MQLRVGGGRLRISVVQLALLVVLRSRRQGDQDPERNGGGHAAVMARGRVGQIHAERLHRDVAVDGARARLGEGVVGAAQRLEQVTRVVEALRRVVGHSADGFVQPEEHRHLEQHRQAPAQRVDVVLLVERHHGLVQGLPVVLVLLLEALYLRLQALHRQH